MVELQLLLFRNVYSLSCVFEGIWKLIVLLRSLECGLSVCQMLRSSLFSLEVGRCCTKLVKSYLEV